MRRFVLLAAVMCVLVPVTADAQVRFLAGAGVTNPMGDLNDAVDVGWHATAGVQVGIGALPVGLRADGGYHSFGEQGANPKLSILSGALSLVVTFPGVGLSPYLLGGVGMYRTSVDVDASDPDSDPGVHGAFGVDIGSLGFGMFAEVRFVNVNTGESANQRYVTAALGFRL
jgi:hypothetical protein